MSSTGVRRPSLFNTPVQTHLAPVVGPPRGLSFRVPHGGSASDAGQPGSGSVTLTPAASPPKAVKAIRKAGKARAKRALKKAAAVRPADLPVQAPDGPPTAESQKGATPLAAPPPVYQVGEPRVPATVTVDAMTRVFAEGLRPMCAHLVGLKKKLEEVHTSVNRLSTSLHTQGVGNERTAQAVVQLQGAVKGVFDGVVGRVKKESVAAPALRGSTAMLDDCQAQQELATINEMELANVRDVAKKAMITEMLGSTESYKAMPNRVRSLEILYDACESVRGGNRHDSEANCNSHRVFLTTAGTPADRRSRVSEKLNRISSHVTEALKKVAMLAYFKSLGVSADSMTPEEAAKWLEKGKYAHSAKADPAINAALTAMFKRNGQKARVVTPKDVGDAVYVDASTGHVGLITHWARNVFEKAAGVRKPRRSGNDDGAYDGWREEVRHVSKFLRKHEDAQDGLRLCDGSDERRAMHMADDGTFVIEESSDELPSGSAGPAETDGSASHVRDHSEELLPGYVSGDGSAEGGDGVDDEEGVDGEEGLAGEAGYDGWEDGEGESGAAADGGHGAGVVDAAVDCGGGAGLGPVGDVDSTVEAGVDAAALAGAAEGVGGAGSVDGRELGDAPPGLLPESAAYPRGLAEYLEEVPL